MTNPNQSSSSSSSLSQEAESNNSALASSSLAKAKGAKEEIHVDWITPILISTGLLIIKNKTLTLQECRILAEIMVRDKAVEFDLESVQLPEEGVQIISEAISKLPTLQSVKLVNTNINDAGLKLILTALSRNKCLHTLTLSNCLKITGEGWWELATAINQGNLPALKYLSLVGNKFGSTSTWPWLEELFNSEHLPPHIDLSKNWLGPKGAMVITQAIKSNKPLISCYLKGSYLSTQGENAIAHALGKNDWTLIIKMPSREAPFSPQAASYLERNLNTLQSNMDKVLTGETLSASNSAKVKQQLQYLSERYYTNIHTANSDAHKNVLKALELINQPVAQQEKPEIAARGQKRGRDKEQEEAPTTSWSARIEAEGVKRAKSQAAGR
jgi:Ran GTPase-activating protein (RanGAP) involved in mRNA processing and transport